MKNSKMIPVRVSSWYSINYNGKILCSLRKNDMYNNMNHEQPFNKIILNDAGSEDVEGEYIIGNLAWQTRKK